MTYWIIRTITNACGLVVAAWMFSGIGFSGDHQVLTVLFVALLFGVVNEFVRPIVSFLSIPFYILTLGLFFFVVNALMLKLVSWFSGQVGIGFHVNGFWTAIFGAIVISLVSSIVGLLLPGGRPSRTWPSYS
jgi:putative membrane protein